MKTISYLLLGDGDFTYSLDLCRYIASLSHQTSNATDETVVYSVTCTGVDTIEELRCKYKDADFVLKNIRQCSNHDDASGESENEIEGSIKLTTSCMELMQFKFKPTIAKIMEMMHNNNSNHHHCGILIM